ncbi:hypothetical protein CC1G_10769 [Coprinopsis cinerea okayama7|uniref:Uncharacterized protein n=1 Tax=Coprinopsis cinerea (strain Okayama-7 / 130 / ATCC MYA-4618 / FGSC 9003) TaxID=240176 RepID=A8P3D5_COPC7|nr:hypothetical protein CC1G_10769 [Coprinopsis cinerea okayama7\|eukprot:XP_001838527.2 hypothetical protein CC1G_10769 [Coprinopsis cinerea okayama7\
MKNSAPGRLQAVNGELYYSPNCSRALDIQEDPYLHQDVNPFQPTRRRELDLPTAPSSSNPAQLSSGEKFKPLYPRFQDISTPRLWTLAFGWMAFVPLRYSDPGFPFNRLKRIPHPLSLGSEGDLVYRMPDTFIHSWSRLEAELFGAVTKLKSKFTAPLVLPFLPWAHGYQKSFRNWRSYDRAVALSRDWFSVWWGALSFLIAYGESKRDAFTLSSHVPEWHTELESEVEVAWIDGVFRSSLSDFSYNADRIGCIVDIVNPPRDQPTVAWLVNHGIPVWYRWGPAEMTSADRSLAPPPELLTGRPEQPLSPGVQTSTASSPTARLHEITSHDERPTGKLERPLPLGNQTSISSPPTTTRYESSKPEPAWVAHFKRHEHLHARIMEKETATQRQSREDRAANPPVSNVRVYEWYPSERDPNVYERVAAGVKNSRDTLALYSARQKVFDAFCREWDCCEYFGKGDEEIDLDEWGPEDLDLPLPESLRQRITKAYSAYVDDEDEEEVGAVTEELPLSPSLAVGQGGGNPSRSVFEPLNLAEQSMAINTTLVEDEEGMFTVSTSWMAACLEDEVNKTLGLHYGFVPPLPSVSIAADDGPRVRRDFYRLLGLCDDEEQPEEYFASTHYRSALQFIHSHSNRQTPHPGSWDLKDDVIHPLKHRSRLRCLRIVSIPHWTNVDIVDEGLSDCVPRYYYFEPPETSKVWRLAVLSGVDALFVCRLAEEFNEDDVVFALAQKGIPFRLFFPRHHIPAPLYRTPSYNPLPVRSLGHKFTKADYESYINTRTLVLAQPHMSAALRRGGIIWRLAVATLGLGDVQKPPMGCGATVSIQFPNGMGEYVDDSLTARELDLICGAYLCIDERTGHTAMKSWWPLARAYERADCGDNYGRWCSRREDWYLKRLRNIENGVENSDQPIAFQQWKTAMRGVGPIRKFHLSIHSSSNAFIEGHIQSPGR